MRSPLKKGQPATTGVAAAGCPGAPGSSYAPASGADSASASTVSATASSRTPPLEGESAPVVPGCPILSGDLITSPVRCGRLLLLSQRRKA